jgi:hypothetical protein
MAAIGPITACGKAQKKKEVSASPTCASDGADAPREAKDIVDEVPFRVLRHLSARPLEYRWLFIRPPYWTGVLLPWLAGETEARFLLVVRFRVNGNARLHSLLPQRSSRNLPPPHFLPVSLLLTSFQPPLITSPTHSLLVSRRRLPQESSGICPFALFLTSHCWGTIYHSSAPISLPSSIDCQAANWMMGRSAKQSLHQSSAQWGPYVNVSRVRVLHFPMTWINYFYFRQSFVPVSGGQKHYDYRTSPDPSPKLQDLLGAIIGKLRNRARKEVRGIQCPRGRRGLLRLRLRCINFAII